MTTPPFQAYVTGTASGQPTPEELPARILTAVAVLASGQNPDGTPAPTTSSAVLATPAPAAWQANHVYTVGQTFTNAGTTYVVDTAYTSGATFGATDLANTFTFGGAGTTFANVGYTASGTAAANETSVFSGSTTAQTVTLPNTPASGTINELINIGSVAVTYAAGASDSINFDGTTGSITVQPGQSVSLSYRLSTNTWYATVPGLGQFTNFQTITGNTTAVANTLYTVNTNAATVTLPTNPIPGQVVGVARGTSSGNMVVTAPAGASINGGTSGGSVTSNNNGTKNGEYGLFLATSSTTWLLVPGFTDWGLGLTIKQNLTVFGQTIPSSGMNLAGGTLLLHTNPVTANYSTSTNSSSGDLVILCSTNSFTVTLTQSTQRQLIVVANENTVASGNAITLAVSAGALYGPATLPPKSGAVFISDGTNWVCIGSWGTAANTSNSAAVSTPTLGAAAQLAQTTADTMLYIAVGTAGTLTVAIGPTSGVTTTIVNGLAAAVGDLYSIRLPAGWYIAVTTGTVATWTTTAITC